MVKCKISIENIFLLPLSLSLSPSLSSSLLLWFRLLKESSQSESDQKFIALFIKIDRSDTKRMERLLTETVIDREPEYPIV